MISILLTLAAQSASPAETAAIQAIAGCHWEQVRQLDDGRSEASVIAARVAERCRHLDQPFRDAVRATHRSDAVSEMAEEWLAQQPIRAIQTVLTFRGVQSATGNGKD